MNELKSNGLDPIIAQAIEEMEAELGKTLLPNEINLAELQRRTGYSRGKVRWFKHKLIACCSNLPIKQKSSVRPSVIEGNDDLCDLLNRLLKQGITNSVVCFQRLQHIGYRGSLASVKRYITKHKDLVPAKRYLVAPQGSRGRRFSTSPGEAFQMDWGFTKVEDPNGEEYRVACFAMVCHHCGECYIEFFPNAKQENLFIGMLHAFACIGVPEYVLTDNMKSVVVSRDYDGHPIWQKDYEAFMNTVGFKTKLCKPRHPFTKGKVERLVRYVKENFLAGRSFINITDLNISALEWCELQNNTYRKFLADIPSKVHFDKCSLKLRQLDTLESIKEYLCPVRKISFDGFINYEGIRFGVPYSYSGQLVRVMRKNETIYIYSNDLKQLLVTHPVTWDKRDQFCAGQYEDIVQPEEFPTAIVKTTIKQISSKPIGLSFDKFDFDTEWEDE